MKSARSPFRLLAVRLLAVLSVSLAAHAAHADSVFRCRAADGAVAFQDHPCAGAAASSVVEIAPAPKAAPSPEYGVEHASRTAHVSHERGGASSHSRRETAHEPTSYECHAANGEVFYRHGACPKQIGRSGATRSRGHGAARDAIAVSGEALPRSEACRRMASGAGRSGRAHDETVSSYDKNLGRDPCRRF